MADHGRLLAVQLYQHGLRRMGPGAPMHGTPGLLLEPHEARGVTNDREPSPSGPSTPCTPRAGSEARKRESAGEIPRPPRPTMHPSVGPSDIQEGTVQNRTVQRLAAVLAILILASVAVAAYAADGPPPQTTLSGAGDLVWSLTAPGALTYAASQLSSGLRDAARELGEAVRDHGRVRA